MRLYIKKGYETYPMAPFFQKQPSTFWLPTSISLTPPLFLSLPCLPNSFLFLSPSSPPVNECNGRSMWTVLSPGWQLSGAE